MSHCVKAATSMVGLCYGLHRLNQWCEQAFPAQKPPELPPSPGYKVFGYMGCPMSKIAAIQERQRLLFFANNYTVPQTFALMRTSWLARVISGDRPVVVQIEIREEDEIRETDLWHDPFLTQSRFSLTPTFVSYYPALPPEVQKRCDLRVRLHHVVDDNVREKGGGKYRAIHQLWEEVTNMLSLQQ